MTAFPRALLVAVLTGALVPFAGCTFVVHFDDAADGGADDLDASPLADGGTDATVGRHPGAPVDASDGDDATPVRDAAPPAPDAPPPSFAFAPPEMAVPEDAGTFVLRGGCQPCAGVAGSTWVCGVARNVMSGCAAATGTVYECENGLPVHGANDTYVGYTCPSGSCLTQEGFPAMCNPCATSGNFSVSADNNPNEPACVACDGGAAAIQQECETCTTDEICQ